MFGHPQPHQSSIWLLLAVAVAVPGPTELLAEEAQADIGRISLASHQAVVILRNQVLLHP
jgi:hypothetical protein